MIACLSGQFSDLARGSPEHGRASTSSLSRLIFLSEARRRTHHRLLRAGVNRMEDQGLETHQWVRTHSREIEIQGQSLVLYRCPVCKRDFAHEAGASTWRAVVVSTFKVEYLPDSVSQEWVSQPCPGTPPTSLTEKVTVTGLETERILPPAPGRIRRNRMTKSTRSPSNP